MEEGSPHINKLKHLLMGCTWFYKKKKIQTNKQKNPRTKKSNTVSSSSQRRSRIKQGSTMDTPNNSLWLFHPSKHCPKPQGWKPVNYTSWIPFSPGFWLSSTNKRHSGKNWNANKKESHFSSGQRGRPEARLRTSVDSRHGFCPLILEWSPLRPH